MRKALLIALALVPAFVFAQNADNKTGVTQPALVSITAKATDVRAIIADLFTQAKRNYVLQPGIQAALFLNLDKVEFEEALHIICDQAKLEIQLQNGIYFIKPRSTVVVTTPKGPLDKSVLARHLTTRLEKSDIRAVFAAFARQTAVAIEVDKSVPNYKLDATLTHASLKYALDRVTEAAGLKYKFTDNLSILVYKPDNGDKIAISGE